MAFCIIVPDVLAVVIDMLVVSVRTLNALDVVVAVCQFVFNDVVVVIVVVVDANL